MHAEPRVERKAVVASPRRVALHRDQRVALLPRRTDGCDERGKAVAAREVAHRADQERREPLALAFPVDDRHGRRQDVRLRPVAVAEPRLEHVVHTGGQPVCGPRGNRAAVADDNVALLVPQHELQLRQLRAQAMPVPHRHLAVAHERGHRVLDLARARGEVGALGVGEHVQGGHSRPWPEDDLRRGREGAGPMRAGRRPRRCPGPSSVVPWPGCARGRARS